MKRISNIIRTLMTLSVSCLIFIECTVSEVDDIYSGFPFIELETESINIAKTIQTVEIPIKTNRKLSFKTSSSVGTGDWLKVSLSEDGTNLQITASANTLETSRTATITIVTPNGLVKRELKVSQDASGELTIQGDLILKSHEEVLNNTYTKTKGALILGNVSNVTTKGSESIECGNYNITVSESDIRNESVDTVTKRINDVAGKTLIIAKTQVSEFPSALILKNHIQKVYLDYNAITAIPAVDVLKDMALTELSLKGNKLSDISSLAGCTTLTHLDIAFNDIYTLDHLDGLTNLKSLDISGLPIPQSHVEVFVENHPGWEIRSSSLKQEASKLAVIDKTDINLVSATQASLSAKIINNNGGSIKEVGFYVGKSNKISEMTKYVGTYSEGTSTITFTYDNGKEITDEMFVRSYAINGTGISYGPRGRLGDPHNYGNVFLKSETEISTFYHDNYLYVEGALVVGASDARGEVAEGDVLISLKEGQQYLKPSDIADISLLSKVITIRDGLYLANTQVEDFSVVSGIKSAPRMWLNANRMSTIPSLGNVEGLKELNLSRNRISDFTPLLGLTNLETLYLGFSETPGLETNDIGMLAGLENMTGLKYLDLSGLPLIQKQVKDLQALMPNCTIVFNAADRPAYLPTVKTGNVTRGDGFVTLNSTLVYNGKTNVTEYGFYIGKDLAAMEKVPVGGGINDQTEFSYQFTSEEDCDFYFYPYAVNSIGEGIDLTSKKFNMFSNNLSQYGTSNCYIVSEAGTYTFDASVKGNSTESVGTIASVEVLWETKGPHNRANAGELISEVELNGTNVIFTTTGLEGNALIAAKDASGTILWSWHIWCTDNPVDHKYVNSKGTFIVQDRHLGAIRGDKGTGDEWKESVGFEYQWGRKDPLVGGVLTQTSESCTLEKTIQNPTVIYDSRVPESKLWLTDEKTMYDPCPVGYHVAPLDIWADFSVSKTYGIFDYGWHFYYNDTEYAWYPVKGRGTQWGYDYWWDSYMTSSSPNNKGFYFSSNYVSANHAWSAEGYDQLRCMRTNLVNINISTKEVQEVTKTSATVSGSIEYIGNVKLTELGFVYSSSTDSPNVNSTKVTTSITEGTFSKTLTGLKPGTKYYVRSFAAEGDIIAYGNVISFTTPMSGGNEGLPEEDYEWE